MGTALSVVVVPTLHGPHWVRAGDLILVAQAETKEATRERVRLASGPR